MHAHMLHPYSDIHSKVTFWLDILKKKKWLVYVFEFVYRHKSMLHHININLKVFSFHNLFLNNLEILPIGKHSG